MKKLKNKMGWKDWPGWLKGALILPLIALVLFPIVLFSTNKIIPDETLLYLYPGVFIVLLGIGMSSQVTSLSQHIPSIAAGIVITLVMYILFGALIGWIYGKTKSKKRRLTK